MRKPHKPGKRMGRKMERMAKNEGGQGIMPSQFSGKKPKIETPRSKKAREKRLENVRM